MTPRPITDDFGSERASDERAPLDMKVLLLYGVARFRKMIVGIVILGALFGLFAGAAMQNQYAVSAKLRFTTSARQTLSEEAAYGVQIDGRARAGSTAVEEELQLLQDPVIYERVVDVIGAKKILAVADPRSGDGPQTSLTKRFMHSLQAGLIHLKGLDREIPDGNPPWARRAAAGKLQASTMVRISGKTKIFDVSYRDSSPARAKTIGDEIVRQMRARHLEEFQASKSLEVLQGSKREAEQKWLQATTAATEFKEQCGFFNLTADFNDCQTQIRDNRLQEQNLEQTRQRLLGTISGLEDELGLRTAGSNESSKGPLNPWWLSLQQDIKEINDDLFELQLVPTPGALNLKRQDELRNKRNKLEAVLANTEKYGAGSGLVALDGESNQALVQTQTLLSTAKGELQGVIKQIEVVREQLKDLQQRRRNMEKCKVEHERLNDAAMVAEAKYKGLTRNELTLSSLAAMDDSDRSNLSLFRDTRLPKHKVGPERSKPLMLGMFGGLALGIGLAAVLQLLERRIRYRETIENQLGLPVLCAIGDFSSKPVLLKARGVA